MQTMLLGEVRIPEERQRTSRDEKKFLDLKKSIQEEGLFHAIIISDNNLLVAGHTRLAAVSDLADAGQRIKYNGEDVPLGQIPYTFTHKTDPISLFKIELEENLRREQLSPVDEATALANLHRLLSSEAPEIVAGTGIREKVDLKETAKVVAEIKGKEPTADDERGISEAILIDAYKDDPDVRKAKSQREAVRAAKKAAERQFRSVLGELEVGQREEPNSRHKIICGDIGEVLEQIPDGTVDVILADPPYGIGADSFGDQSFGHDYADDEEAFWNVILPLAMGGASRICKPDAAMFIFLDLDMYYELCRHAYDEGGMDMGQIYFQGWYLWPTPLFWYKTNKGHAPQPKRGPSRRWEAILYAIRGDREVRKVGQDVLPYAAPDVRLHGAEKPVELYKELLSWICYPGDVVLDPCAGSGTTAPAAEVFDCGSILVERDPGFAQICRDRVEEILQKEKEKENANANASASA